MAATYQSRDKKARTEQSNKWNKTRAKRLYTEKKTKVDAAKDHVQAAAPMPGKQMPTTPQSEVKDCETDPVVCLLDDMPQLVAVYVFNYC